MIKAVVRNGQIHPLEPMPSDWKDGQEVRVESGDVSPPQDGDLDEWLRELDELGPVVYEPGEREAMQAVLDEADRQAKEIVRRQMGLT
jgi:hypothetical protein